MSLADVFSVIEFYAMFNRRLAVRTILRTCDSPVCAAAGADSVIESLCRHLKIKPNEISADGEFTIEHALCLGL